MAKVGQLTIDKYVQETNADDVIEGLKFKTETEAGQRIFAIETNDKLSTIQFIDIDTKTQISVTNSISAVKACSADYSENSVSADYSEKSISADYSEKSDHATTTDSALSLSANGIVTNSLKLMIVNDAPTKPEDNTIYFVVQTI